LDPSILDPKPFIFFGSATGSEAVRSSSSGANYGSEAVHFLWFRTGSEAVRHFLWIRNRIRSRTAVWAVYRDLVELTIPTLIHQVVSGFD
jgi:hypothetical protein